MAVQKQDDQHEHTFSSCVRIQDVVLRTCLGRWTIGRSGERGSGISVLPARHDDGDEVFLSNCNDLQTDQFNSEPHFEMQFSVIPRTSRFQRGRISLQKDIVYSKLHWQGNWHKKWHEFISTHILTYIIYLIIQVHQYKLTFLSIIFLREKVKKKKNVKNSCVRR